VGNPDGRRHASFLPQLSPDGTELLGNQGWILLSPDQQTIWSPALGRRLVAGRYIHTSVKQLLWRPRGQAARRLSKSPVVAPLPGGPSLAELE